MGKLRANSEIISDKSKNPVTTSTYIKHGNQWLDDAVNNAIGAAASKADKTYVDSELTKKANKSDTDAALSSKADKSELSTKADKSALEATNASVSVNTSNIQELSTESTVLSARMDEFTKLEEGSTTGDAELADGRVGADGKTYDNIGGAIRGQVTDLKSDLSDIKGNIYTEITVDYFENRAWSTADGTDETNNNMARTKGYLPISIQNIHADYGYPFVVFAYDKYTEEFIGVWNGTEFKKTTKPWKYDIEFSSIPNSENYRFKLILHKTDNTAPINEIIQHVFFDFWMETPAKNIVGAIDFVNNSNKFNSDNIAYLSSENNMEKFTLADLSSINANIIRAEEGEIQPCFEITKKVKNELYIGMKVVIPSDVHSLSGDFKICGIKSKNKTSPKLEAILKKALTTIRDSYPLCPCPVYNAGIFSALDNYQRPQCRIVPDGFNQELMLGDDIMSIRFTGDCTQTVNQDIMLKVDSSEIKIYHSNTNATIGVYTKSNYANAEDFYNAVSNDIESGALSDFEIEWYNLGNHTLDDIIECTVHLVAPYKTSSGSSADRYDAFPYYFTSKEKNNVYDIEIVLRKNAKAKSQLIVNGYGVNFNYVDGDDLKNIFNNEVSIVFGDASKTTGNVEFKEIRILDNPQCLYPNLRVYYSEGVVNGLTNGGNVLRTSEKLIDEFVSRMRENGAGYANFNEVLGYLAGSNSISENKAIFHFAHDDSSWNSITDRRILETYLRNDIKPSFALMMHQNPTDEQIKMYNALKHLQYFWYIHSVYSSESKYYAKSMGYFTYSEMAELVTATVSRFIEVYNDYPIAWDFHEEGEGYNQCRYLKNHGFEVIFGETGNGLLSSVNRFHCKRATVRDVSYDFNNIKKYLDNYVNNDVFESN